MSLADFYVPDTIQSVVIQRVVIRMGLCTRVLVLRAVNVNWNDDGWNVNANSVENSNRWNADNQVFSRNYCVSPALDFIFGREFCFAVPSSIRLVVGRLPQVLLTTPSIFL